MPPLVPVGNFLFRRSWSMNKPLYIDIDLHHRRTQHLLKREFDPIHNIMSDFRDGQAVLQRDIDINSKLIIENSNAHPLIALLRRQKHRLPIAEPRQRHSQYTVTITGSLHSDGLNSVGQDFYFAAWTEASLWLSRRCFWHTHISLSCQNSQYQLYSLNVLGLSNQRTSFLGAVYQRTLR